MKSNHKEYLVDVCISSLFYFLNEYTHRSALYSSGLMIYLPVIILRSALLIGFVLLLFKMGIKKPVYSSLNKIAQLRDKEIKRTNQQLDTVVDQKKSIDYKKIFTSIVIVVLFFALGSWFMKNFPYNLGVLIIAYRISSRTDI